MYQFSVCLFNWLERLESVGIFVNQKGGRSEEAKKQTQETLLLLHHVETELNLMFSILDLY